MNEFDLQRAETGDAPARVAGGHSRLFPGPVLERCELLRLKPTQRVYQAGDEPGGLFGVIQRRGWTQRWRMSADTDSGSATRPLGKPGGEAGAPLLWLALPGAAPYAPDLQRLAAREPVNWAHVASLLARNVLCVNLIDALKRNEPLIRLAAILNRFLEEAGREAAHRPRLLSANLAPVSHPGRGSVNAALNLIRRRYGAIELLRPSELAPLAGRWCARAFAGAPQ